MNEDRVILESKTVDESSGIDVREQILRIACYDEFHALEVYKKVIQTFGNIAPFSNIVQSEQRHIDACLSLCAKYGVNPPINDWQPKITIPSTVGECCALGVQAEIDNVAMYDRLLFYASDPDIIDVFYSLQAASANNHLNAFSACAMQNTDLSKLIPTSMQGLLQGQNRDFLIGTIIGAGLFYMVDQSKNKSRKD